MNRSIIWIRLPSTGNYFSIFRAKKIQKGLGGSARQVGFMAAAAIYALDNMVERLADDHKHAQMVANGKYRGLSDFIYTDLHYYDAIWKKILAQSRLIFPSTLMLEKVNVNKNNFKSFQVRSRNLYPYQITWSL